MSPPTFLTALTILTTLIASATSDQDNLITFSSASKCAFESIHYSCLNPPAGTCCVHIGLASSVEWHTAATGAPPTSLTAYSPQGTDLCAIPLNVPVGSGECVNAVQAITGGAWNAAMDVPPGPHGRPRMPMDSQHCNDTMEVNVRSMKHKGDLYWMWRSDEIKMRDLGIAFASGGKELARRYMLANYDGVVTLPKADAGVAV